MTFDEWWDKERQEHAKEYVLMGSFALFALRNIAKAAWDTAVLEMIKQENKK